MTSSRSHSMLPSLSPEEQAHSSAVVAHIADRIRAAGGWISFEEFMELALYAPGLGYYSAGSIKLGASGDFVTAPEISDLFSQCVARQCADVLAEIGGAILELGAGTGRMASVIMRSLAELGVLPERYYILEVSADLADRQRARISLELPPELQERVVWIDRLPAVPIRGVVLANEVLDALPVRRFIVRDGAVVEVGVGSTPAGAPDASSTFEWRASTDNLSEVSALIRELPTPLPNGYVSEACIRVEPWIAGVGACLEKGAILFFDYGLPRSHFYHPQRTDGTLRCYFRQHAHDDPFINVGVQDITAWVDFTRVAEAGLAIGLDVVGFVTQAAFLLGTGIEALTAEAADSVERARLAGEARRLLMPGEMGESFKVMALCHNLEQPLRGFAYQDLRRFL